MQPSLFEYHTPLSASYKLSAKSSSASVTLLLACATNIPRIHLKTTEPMHKLDSIQGTDYIANHFFLNLSVIGQKLKI